VGREGEEEVVEEEEVRVVEEMVEVEVEEEEVEVVEVEEVVDLVGVVELVFFPLQLGSRLRKEDLGEDLVVGDENFVDENFVEEVKEVEEVVEVGEVGEAEEKEVLRDEAAAASAFLASSC